MGKQRRARKKQTLGVGGAVCIALLAGCYVLVLWRLVYGGSAPGRGQSPADVGETVFLVNGEAVTAREVEQRIAYVHRAEAIQRFSPGSGLQVDEAFWDTEVDGATPRAYLRQQTVEDCARLKLQQIAMKEHGLLDDISYQSFLEGLAAENLRRAESRSSGEVIYGPQQYGENEYFVYIFSNRQKDLKEKLAAAFGWNAQADLEAYYEGHKERDFRLSDSIEAESLSFPYDRTSKETAAEAAEAVRRAVESGISFSQAAQGLDAPKRLTFNEESAREDSRHREPLKLAAMQLAPGEISPPVDDGQAYHLVLCLEKEAGGYRPFDEVRDQIANLVCDERYGAWLDAQYAGAQIQMKDDAVFKRVR